MFLVGAQSGHEGDGSAGERAVDHQSGGGGEVQVRREEAAHGLAVDAGCSVERAMAADEVVAEGELGMPSVGVSDDVKVARGDELVGSEQPNDSATRFSARADEVGGFGGVVSAGHLAVVDEEEGALARPGDPGRCARPATGEVSEAALSAELGGFRLRNGVEVELALGGEEHAIPGEEAEPPVVRIKVGDHQEAFLAAFGQVRALGAKWASDDANRQVDRVDVGVTRNDEPTCPERLNDPAAGFVAGADEVGGPGDFAPAGHLAVGDEEKDALARLGDPYRCAGPATVGVSKAVLGARGMGWKSS